MITPELLSLLASERVVVALSGAFHINVKLL
jgi:hypothetical protein